MEKFITDCGEVELAPTYGTELVFILDRSGSMGGLEADTIGGFNSLIEKQKSESGEGLCLVSTVLFDHESELLYDRVELGEVEPMTKEQYFVRGCTALVDALGSAITHIKKIHRYARNSDVPKKTVFVIITDGQENASRQYTSDQVKRLIEQQKEKGWEFLFIGANIDAVETAKHYGISEDRAVDYHADEKGTSVVYDTVACACCEIRANAPLTANWSDKIKKDYESR